MFKKQQHSNTLTTYCTRATIDNPLTTHWLTNEKPLTNHWETIEKPLTNHWQPTDKPLPNHWQPIDQPLTNHWQPIDNHWLTIDKPLTNHWYKPLTNHWQTLTNHWQLSRAASVLSLLPLLSAGSTAPIEGLQARGGGALSITCARVLPRWRPPISPKSLPRYYFQASLPLFRFYCFVIRSHWFYLCSVIPRLPLPSPSALAHGRSPEPPCTLAAVASYVREAMVGRPSSMRTIVFQALSIQNSVPRPSLSALLVS